MNFKNFYLHPSSMNFSIITFSPILYLTKVLIRVTKLISWTVMKTHRSQETLSKNEKAIVCLLSSCTRSIRRIPRLPWNKERRRPEGLRSVQIKWKNEQRCVNVRFALIKLWRCSRQIPDPSNKLAHITFVASRRREHAAASHVSLASSHCWMRPFPRDLSQPTTRSRNH